MYVNTLGKIGDILGQKFGYVNNPFPKKIGRKTEVKLGNMKLRFNKYSVNKGNRDTTADDFALYFPIHAALKEKESLERLN